VLFLCLGTLFHPKQDLPVTYDLKSYQRKSSSQQFCSSSFSPLSISPLLSSHLKHILFLVTWESYPLKQKDNFVRTLWWCSCQSPGDLGEIKFMHWSFLSLGTSCHRMGFWPTGRGYLIKHWYDRLCGLWFEQIQNRKRNSIVYRLLWSCFQNSLNRLHAGFFFAFFPPGWVFQSLGFLYLFTFTWGQYSELHAC
jgi:hypothetical protein